MHNKQHLQINNNTISKLAVVVLSIILITGIFFIPVLQAGVYAQQPPTQQQQSQQLQRQQPLQQQQQNRVGLSQVIRQIAQQVATANPGTNETNVYQILVQLAKQTAAQTSSQEEAIKEISQISSQVTTYPFGTLSQVLSHFAGLISSGNSTVAQIVQQTLQQKASSGSSSSNNITQSLSNTAIQEASSGSTNVNLVIRNAAQILANRVGVPVEKVEAVIIQMALQFAQAQGRAITGQYIFQLANQIIQDPNGVLAQAILQLVKQYMIDNGKTIQTVNIINNVIKTGGSSSKTIVKVFERDGGGGQNQTIPTPPKDDEIRTCPQDAGLAQFTCQTGKSEEQLCSEQPEIPDCKLLLPPEKQRPIAVPTSCDPNTQSCPPAVDPCEEDPNAEGCPPPEEDICKENPNAEGCEALVPPPPSDDGDADAGDTDTDDTDDVGGGGDDSGDNGDSGDSDDSGGSTGDGGGDAAKPT